jgi:hypothetical protein
VPSAKAKEVMSCPIEGCEEKFTQQNRARHMRKQHGIESGSEQYRALFPDALPRKRGSEAPPAPHRALNVSAQVEQSIREMTKPLKDELRKINARLSAMDIEGQELRAARKRIEQVLKQLDPTSFVAAPKGKRGYVSPSHMGGSETKEARRLAVLAFLEEHRDQYADGLTAAGIHRDMKAAGIEPISGPSRILEQVRELHANGVLRADRKIRGGAMQYKFVGNGATDGAS